MEKKSIWKFILEQLTEENPVALVVVVEHEKGSPGKSGFKLAVTADKKIAGTMGGGIMEYQMIEQYSKRLKNNETIRDIRYLVHSPNAKHGEPSGLSCAGSQTNCIISLNKNDRLIIEKIYFAEKENIQARFILTENGISYSEGKKSEHKIFHSSSPAEWKYEENIGPEYTLFIIGGGHVGNALSRVMSTLDFYVVLYDDRSDLVMMKDNNFADKKIIAPFEKLGEYLSNPQKTFAAIVTSNFVSDAAALQQVLPHKLPYVGLMGVEAKIVRIKNSLNEEEQKLLSQQKIFAPIGMEIGSATAEEIAVSIAAQLIQVKNSLSKK